MSTTTVITIPYTGTNQTANVTATYGVPVTAHIWGAGGGSTGLYAGAGGGYSRVRFVAQPGDKIAVVVGQGGGGGGITQPPPAPPTTWTTRSPGYTGTPVYPGYNWGLSQLSFLSTNGIWSNPNFVLGSVNDTWSVYFPVSGYYNIQGQSRGCGPNPYANPNGNPGTISIDGTAVLTCTIGGGYGPDQAKVWINAGYHSITVVADASYSRGSTIASVAFAIDQANPSRIPNAPAGSAGAGYIALFFNTRFPPAGQAPVYAYGNGDSFLDQWGVWGADQNETSFQREYTVTFAQTNTVLFQMSASDTGSLMLDGSTIISRTSTDDPNTPSQYTAKVTQGTHVIRISASGAIGALKRVGVIYGTGDQTSFSGGRGGIADPTSNQGFGGGGGGATLLVLNGQYIGVGAGGGGGAGTAPNPNNSESAITNSLYNGQNGQDIYNFNTADTGGGGGGGGGARGGNGGAGRGSGGGGFGGYNGTSLGDITANPTGQMPYTNDFYPGGGVAQGGSAGTASQGGNGFVALEFQTGGGGVIKDNGEWKSIQHIYVKDAGAWTEVKSVYINQDGIWRPIQGTEVPVFASIDGLFGTWSRPYSAGALFAPPPPAPNYSEIGGDGFGWGGEGPGGGEGGDGGGE